MNKISFSIHYVTNFKPSRNFNDSYSFFNNKNNIVLCKHFIVFFYLIKFILKKNTSVKIFFKPTRNKIETILRPPYRHKISRHQITLSRYFLTVSFFTKLNKHIVVSNTTQIITLTNEITKHFSFFETNICYTHSVRVRISFLYNNFFKLMNYKTL